MRILLMIAIGYAIYFVVAATITGWLLKICQAFIDAPGKLFRYIRMRLAERKN